MTIRSGIAILLFALASAGMARAQIATDGTVGPAGSLQGPEFAITSGLGTQSGGNLFHSFSLFNLATGERATFSGPTSVENIISRVTGGSTSSIDGQIRSTIPEAGFYLINPAGILFGPNASLDLGGSFHVSTADSLTFSDGATFSAIDPASGSTFTVAAPDAFGFLGVSPMSIELGGASLVLPDEARLTIVGGDLSITDGSISTPDGTLTLASVAGSAQVPLDLASSDLSAVDSLGSISISGGPFNPTTIMADGDRGGSIVIRGNSLTTNGATLQVNTQGDGPGGGIDINLRGGLDMTGDNASTFTSGSGIAGTVQVQSARVALRGGSQLVSFAGGSGQAGKVSVMANEEISVTGHNENGRVSAILSATEAGKAGTVFVHAPLVNVSDNGLIFADTLGSGIAGEVTITGDRLEVVGGGRISSASGGTGPGGPVVIKIKQRVSVSGVNDAGDASSISARSFAGGNAGSVTVEAPQMSVADGGIISASSLSGPGAAGVVMIKGGRLEVSGGGAIGSGTFGEGPGGNLNIMVDRLEILSGGIISAETQGSGNAGSIEVTAKEAVLLKGQDITGRQSQLITTAFPNPAVQSQIGRSGRIALETSLLSMDDGKIASETSSQIAFEEQRNALLLEVDDLFMTKGSLISTITNGAANAESIVVNVKNRARISDNSKIESETRGSGNGGDISLSVTGDIQLFRNSVLSSSAIVNGNVGNNSATVTGNGGNILVSGNNVAFSNNSGIAAVSTSEAGLAGNVKVNAEALSFENQSGIATSASLANGGDIDIQVSRVVDLRRSQITTSVPGGDGSGGNIFIDPDFVILNDSRIQADAFGGPGGNITIIADNIFQTPSSAITASSALSVAGTISISAPETDITGNLAELSTNLIDATALLQQACAARTGQATSSFVNAGRGGLPLSPEQLQTATYLFEQPRLTQDGGGSENTKKHGRSAWRETLNANRLAGVFSPCRLVFGTDNKTDTTVYQPERVNFPGQDTHIGH